MVDLNVLRDRYSPLVKPVCSECSGEMVMIGQFWTCKAMHDRRQLGPLETKSMVHKTRSSRLARKSGDPDVVEAIDELEAFREAFTVDRKEPPDKPGWWLRVVPFPLGSGLTVCEWIYVGGQDETLFIHRDVNGGYPLSECDDYWLWGRRPLPMPASVSIEGDGK